MRPRVLTLGHDRCGHLGEEKTLLRLRARYHWYGMKRDTVDWVRSCASCSQRKPATGRGRGAPLVSTWSGYPWERVAMDLIPNLPMTSRGNRRLLVVIDYFSKWAEAFPLPVMTAQAIADAFLNGAVARFGAPTSVHTDQGRNFDSVLFRDVCQLLGITKTRTTAYHPQGDGLVERLNQTLERMLSHYVASAHCDWDFHLPKVMMAYRSAVQSSTGYSPHYVLFGREMRLSSDVVYDLPDDHPRTAPFTFAWRLREHLAAIHACIRSRLAVNHRHQQIHYDRRAVPVSFLVDDFVWLLVPHCPTGQSPKFAPRWRGPYRVLEKLQLSPVLQDTRPPERYVITHVNRMKRCCRRPDDLTVVPELPDLSATVTADESSSIVVPPSPYRPDPTDNLYNVSDDLFAEQWSAVPQGRPRRHRQLPPRFAGFDMS